MSNVIKINNITIEDINYTNGRIQLNGEITLTINEEEEETYTIQDGKPTLKTTETKLTTEELKQETEPREATINIHNLVDELATLFQQGQEQPQESKKISLDFNKLTSKDLAGELNTIFNPPIRTN